MVKIFVGPKRKEWVIHEDLICDRSDYFKAVFKDGFKETDEKEIHLDDDPAAFALFVDWIYGAELRSNNAQSEWSHVQDLGALWVFADKIRLPEVKNEVCLLYDVYLKRRFVDVEEVRSIYRNTLEASGLRRSVARSTVDFYLNVANKDRELEHFLKIIGSNATFGLDVARELKSRIRMRN
jgi:hypothetical protein